MAPWTILFCLCALVLGEELSLFHHRAWHNAIVLGNYLYLDGGELSTWDGQGNEYWQGWPETYPVRSAPDNFTHSIDISSSWTNSSVVVNNITKTSPTLNFEALWSDKDGQRFFTSMGAWSGNIPLQVPSEQVWEFTPSGDTGAWDLLDGQPTDENGKNIARISNGLYASGNGLGFVLGGMQFYGNTKGYDLYTPVSGMVIFNSTSGTNYNVSAGDWNLYGTITNGAAHFVPSFGPAGLLFVFGGTTTIYTATTITPDPTANSVLSPLAFSTLYMYDPQSQQWSTQEASGDIPLPVLNPCVTGLAGDDGTYEIFLLGGVDPNDIHNTISMNTVYVLSLPSFHWTKTSSTAEYGRYGHKCNIIGNRQIVVTGGLVVDVASAEDRSRNYGWAMPDPWQNGIGVFDISELQWRDSYDADAASYVTPKLITGYINDHGPYPSTWTNEINQDWFEVKLKNNTGTSSSLPSDHPDSVSSGVIAGAAVGGVVGLIVVVLVAFFWTRRSRKVGARRTNEHPDPAFRDKHELDATANAVAEVDPGIKHGFQQHELHPHHLNELPGSYSGTELADKGVHGQVRTYEMGS